jgi:hypothetical protein
MKFSPDEEDALIDRAMKRNTAENGSYPSRGACVVEYDDDKAFVSLKNNLFEVARYAIEPFGLGVRLIRINIKDEAA